MTGGPAGRKRPLPSERESQRKNKTTKGKSARGLWWCQPPGRKRGGRVDTTLSALSGLSRLSLSDRRGRFVLVLVLSPSSQEICTRRHLARRTGAAGSPSGRVRHTAVSVTASVCLSRLFCGYSGPRRRCMMYGKLSRLASSSSPPRRRYTRNLRTSTQSTASSLDCPPPPPLCFSSFRLRVLLLLVVPPVLLCCSLSGFFLTSSQASGGCLFSRSSFSEQGRRETSACQTFLTSSPSCSSFSPFLDRTSSPHGLSARCLDLSLVSTLFLFSSSLRLDPSSSSSSSSSLPIDVSGCERVIFSVLETLRPSPSLSPNILTE